MPTEPLRSVAELFEFGGEIVTLSTSAENPAGAIVLSPMQRQLWSSQRRNPYSPHQNTALLSTIGGRVEPDRLAAAFATVVAASDVLRTRIKGDTVTLSDQPPVTETITMDRRSASEWAADRASVPLNMEEGGIDSVVVQHPDGTTSWYLNLHHVITDATASAAIFEATAAVYHGAVFTTPPYYRWSAGDPAGSADARTARAIAHWADRTPMPRSGRLYDTAHGTASTRLDVRLPSELRTTITDRLGSDYAALSDDLAWTSLLMTAGALYLHRISGATQMALGLPVHNRSTPEAEAVLGPVMQVFAVDVSIDTSDTHRSLHRRVAKSVMKTVRHAKAGLTPNLSDIEAVVNVIPRAGITSFGELPVTTEWVHSGATDPSHLFQLQLTTYAGDDPELSIDINAAAAGAQTDRVAGHLLSMVEELVADPDAPIGSTTVLATDEVAELRAWGDRTAEAPDVPLLTQLLADSLPSATLTHDNRSLTGADLVDAVGRTAAWIRNELAVAPGDRVAVRMGRSADAVLAILGILWSGASYVPIDPCQPERRQRSLIERAGCAEVIDHVPDVSMFDPATPLPVAESDEAYLLFTSGSTGEPKGVPITHRGVADYLHFARNHYLDNGDAPIVPLFSALTFDLTVTSLFLPLLTGGELIVIEPDGVPGLKRIAETPRITWAKATPSHLELLLRLVPEQHGLRTLVIGGEALSARLTDDLWSWQPQLRIFNEYGPTEAVVGCMIHQASPEDPDPEVPIGRPAPGVELRVVDAHDCEVPIGSPGELLIHSRGLTRGYLGTSNGNADEQAGSFIELDDRRFYRSGDLVRFVAPGVLTYLGRADEQIKVGGIRLDPTEVEFQLEQHPDIRRSAVRLAENDLLTAWFETETGNPSPMELRTWLGDRVPSHAVPAAYVAVDELPTTTNGKLDRRRLPSPGADHRPGSGSHDSSPTSDLEKTVISIWADQLNIGHPGPDTDFFDSGGDSLAGMESVHQLAVALGFDLPEELIFGNRTPRLLAAAVQAGTWQPLSEPDRTSELPPLSPGERAMVFSWLNDPDTTANNVGRSYLIDGDLDPERLRSAAEQLVARHLPLRLTYTEPRAIVPVDRALDFSVHPASDRSSAETHSDRLFAQPFDPDQGPRVRMSVTPLVGGGTALVLAMHHALIDEAGLDRLFEDLADLYAGDPLPDLPTDYASFARAQNSRADSADDREYWLGQPDADTLDLGPSGGADGYLEMPTDFDAHHLDRFVGVAPVAVALASVADVVSRRAEARTVQVGMPISVRTSREHSLAGYGLNVLPLTVEPSLDSATEAITNTLTHRNYPFASIVVDRRSAGRPVPPLQVLLAFGNLRPATIGGFRAEHRVLAPVDATTDVTFFVQVRGDRVNLALEYAGRAIDAVGAERLLNDFHDSLLHGVDEHTVAGTVPPDWNSEPARSTLPTGLLDELVAERAVQTPAAVAVSAGTNELTYGELFGQANAVAHQLVEAGVEPGAFVGVLADRSLPVVPTVLGVLRAGCAYVPIDPAYPAERIGMIIEDSGIDVVLAPPGVVSTGVARSVAILPATADTAAEPPEVHRSTDDIAYAIFTSGSTGRPKGVAVTHRNIVYSTTVRRDVYEHTPTAFLLLSSFAFDSSMVGLWWTLCSGGEIALPDPGLHTDVDHLAEIIDRRRVSHLLAIPSLYSVLLSETDHSKLAPLNTVMVAGEACPSNLVAAHYDALPQAGLHNEYGPTEATVWSHHHLFDATFDAAQPVPIGRPVPGVEQLVLDETGEPVGQGQSGELYVGGPGVTDGYVGQAELTADRFPVVHDRRYYRTGDLVRWLPDGALEFLGRVDQQVKVRGVRIELGEVEQAVLTDAAVQSAAAGTIDTPQGARLAVWVRLQPGTHLDSDSLKRSVGERLPAAMVPSQVIEVADMPLTPNGKIDRSALPQPETAVTAPIEAGPIKGANRVQTAMLSLWAEVLGAPGVGIHDNFFDLGGDSILSIRIVSGLRRHGIRIRPRDLFDHPTIAELEAVAAVQSADSAPKVDRFVGLALLLPMQEWFFQQDFAAPNHWNQSMWFDLAEPVDVAKLEQAFAAVVDHHDSLRAVFTGTELGWVQRIAESVPMVRVQEFHQLPADAVGAVTASIEAGMDIEGGRLIGAGLFRHDSGDRLFITIHHLVVDGVSWRPIVEDLTAAYRGQPLAPRTSSVASFGSELTRLPADPYWDRVGTMLPPPSAVRRPQSAGRQLTVSVDAGVGGGVFERLLGAVAAAHREAFGDERLIATLEGHGRAEEIAEDLDLSRTVGWFTSMYPIVVDPAAPVVLDAPLGGVGALDQIPAPPRMVINYLGQLDRSIAGTDLLVPASGIEAGYGEGNHRTHDLGIMAHITDDTLHITWDFVPEDHPEALVRKAADAFLRHFSATPSFDLVQLSESDLAALDQLFT